MEKSLKKSLVLWKVFHGLVVAAIAIFTFVPCNLVAQSGNKGPSYQGKKTRIYTVVNSNVKTTGAAYSVYHPEIKIPKDEEILGIFKEKCKEVEFVGETKPNKETVNNIKAQKENLDGILCFGHPSNELISIGLPMVAVFRLWGEWFPLSYNHNDFKGKKIVTSCLPVLPDKDRSVYSNRIEDIVGKIKLIDAISKMKGLRVLVVTDKPPLGVWEPYDFQIKTSREEYEKDFIDNLKETFDAYLVPIPQNDLVERMKVQDKQKAKEVTKKWIAESSGIRGTNEAQILRSAKLYLAMKELLVEYNCGAIATEGYGSFPGGYNIVPSQGLPSSQLCTDGIVAVGETLLNSLITQQLGLNFTGSTGQNGDYFVDFLNNIAITAHCEAPFNPYGDGERVPYILRNLPFFKEENTCGAVVQVNYPIGKTVTVAKIDMNNKKISIFTGETVSGEELFPYWNDLLCRTKVAIKTNAKALHDNRDWETFGHHRVTFFGDYRQEFLDLATLIGFEAVECDKSR